MKTPCMPSWRDHFDPLGVTDELTGNKRWNGGQECDMDNGPCSCGAWHHLHEPRVIQFPIYKLNPED